MNINLDGFGQISDVFKKEYVKPESGSKKAESADEYVSNSKKEIAGYNPRDFIKKARDSFISKLSDEEKSFFLGAQEKMKEFFNEDEFIKTAVTEPEEMRGSFLESAYRAAKALGSESPENEEIPATSVFNAAPPLDYANRRLIGGFGIPEGMPESKEDVIVGGFGAPEIEKSQNSDAESGSFSVDFSFDLFYSLSKTFASSESYEDGNAFHESFASVTEKFSADFSLKVEVAGKMLSGTDALMNLAPESAKDFFNAIDNLAALDEDSLASFIDTADKFFSELDENFGDADGDTFDVLKNLVSKQAEDFVSTVNSLSSMIENPESFASVIEKLPEPDESVNAANELLDSGNKNAADFLAGSILDSFDQYSFNSFFLQNFESFLFKTQNSSLDELFEKIMPQITAPAETQS